MANTVDTLGEQETLDKLVAHTLEDFEDNRITTVRAYAFCYSNGLKSVNLPNATTSGKFAFQSCFNIESINIPKITNVPESIFSNCYRLSSLEALNANTLSNNSFEKCYSLNGFNLSNITKVENYALTNAGFGTVTLPNCTSLGSYVINGTRTSTVDLSTKITIPANCFRDAYSLMHLILRSNDVCSLASTSALTTTPISNGIGWIYVPTDLVNTYKTASNWSTYADRIVSIDEYPKALTGETITDTWDEIFQAEDNNTYKTKYSVGDTKYLIVGGTYVLMQIIAFDRDILSSDHTSTAKITWLAKSLSFHFPMNFEAVTEGGWADCECRKFLSDTIYEQIPENVRNRILAVDKTYIATSSSSSTATVSDKLWIPSIRELYGSSPYENAGVDYTDFFTSSSISSIRIKHNGLLTNSATFWWLRSVASSMNFYCVSNGGGFSTTTASGIVGFPLGFCT